MVIKRGANGKRQYILPVCNMTCLNLCYFLPYLLRQTPKFGTYDGVAHPTPLRIF